MWGSILSLATSFLPNSVKNITGGSFVKIGSVVVLGVSLFGYVAHLRSKIEAQNETLESNKRSIELIQSQSKDLVSKLDKQVKDYDVYRRMMEEQNKRVNELINADLVRRAEITELKKRMTVNSLTKRGKTEADVLEKEINEKTKALIDSFKETKKK